MATKLLSSAECNFSEAACETLARLAVDNTIGHDDFLSDAHQNSFVLDLVSAVGSRIAFNAISRQLWRINQYTPYSDAAYAYGQSYASCPTSFLIAHSLDASASLVLSNEQQRTLAAFINARVSISSILEVCPYHVLMSFCNWLNAPGADNSKKVMTLDGSIAYNTRNLVNNGPYAYDNSYDESTAGRDYLSSAIYHYQLTSLLQTGFAFGAAYPDKSIMSGFVLDTMYSSASTDVEKFRLVAALILGVNSNNVLRGGYVNVANVYQITTSFDGTTFSRASSKSVTKLSPAILNAFLNIETDPKVYYNNGLAVVEGRTLTGSKILVTATNLSAQDYFEAYALQGVSSDITTLKNADYNVKQISGIKNTNNEPVAAFQSVQNFRTAGFSYTDIISSTVGLGLSTPQQYYDKVVSQLNTTPLEKINLMNGAPFNLSAAQIYSMKSDASGTIAFNDATKYIDASFSYGIVNTVFDVSSATAFYNTYKLNALATVDAITSLKTNGQYNISAIKTVSPLSATIPNYKSAGFTFTDIKAGFDASLNTAQKFYDIFNNDANFNIGNDAYSTFQQIFILKTLGYDVSGVNSITRVSSGVTEKVYPNIITYQYTVQGTTGTGTNITILDSRLKTNVPAVTGDKSFSLESLRTAFNITTAQTAFNALGLTGVANADADIRRIKNLLPSVTVSDIKSIKKNNVVVANFQIPSNYSGDRLISVNNTDSITIAGFTNTEITTGFSSDYKALLSMSSETSLPSFTYVDATYSSNGSNLLTKLADIASEKNEAGAYVSTTFRSLLLNSINETRAGNTESPSITDTTLVGNILKYAVYRLVYISVVANSAATSGAYSPTTVKGMYSYFDLPTFKSYLATGTKYSDFLKSDEYLYYSTATNMVAPTTTTSTANGVTTTTSTYRSAQTAAANIVTSRSYDKQNAIGVSLSAYQGVNSLTVRYALGKIASGRKALGVTNVTNNSVSADLFYDSGLSIPDAVAAISSPVKASVLDSNAWPVETHVLLSLPDVVSYVKSNFYDETKSLDANIAAALELSYSSTAWNFANIMNGPLNNRANKMNLDGVSWKQMIAAGAPVDALVADLAANINFVSSADFTTGSGNTTITYNSEFVSQYGVPYAQALVIAKKLHPGDANDTKGRVTSSANGRWTVSALAGNPYYSKSQRKALFNSNAVLASQVLSNDAFIALKWTPAELSTLMPKLEIADLLTATEAISNEFDSNYTSTSNSAFIRMLYDTNADRLAIVKAKYPALSDAAANAIAVLTVYSDIVDAVAGN